MEYCACSAAAVATADAADADAAGRTVGAKYITSSSIEHSQHQHCQSTGTRQTKGWSIQLKTAEKCDVNALLIIKTRSKKQSRLKTCCGRCASFMKDSHVTWKCYGEGGSCNADLLAGLRSAATS